jgi:hypothetical protein
MAVVSEDYLTKSLEVTFDNNGEPKFKFAGNWNIKDIGHTRNTVFRAYKHYIKGIRNTNKEEVRDERTSD